MVASYKKLFKRLQGYIRFQEVARAVRFVAGGELGKLRKKLKKRFTALGSFLPLFSKKYVHLNEYNKCLVVPISDDRGSCGAHNNRIVSATMKFVDGLEENSKDFKLYIIGKKGFNFSTKTLKKHVRGYTIGLVDVKFTVDMCFYFLMRFNKILSERLYFIFNRYFTTQIQRSGVYRLINFINFYESIFKNIFGRFSIYYNSIVDKIKFDTFLQDLYDFGVALFSTDALNENKFSFYGGRFTAMDTAVTNTQEIIEHLRILYNKARQEYITTELVEIVSCAESMSSTE